MTLPPNPASQTDAPLATIGITAYNARDSIGKAILSALAQTWRPIEIIVVDDASSDGTSGEIEQLAQRHPEIVAIRHEQNLGVAAARNSVISTAQGEFIAFFDDDDESAPDRIEQQIDRISDYELRFAHGAPVVCHTARLQNLPDGGTRIAATMGESFDRVAPHGPAVASRILAGTPLANAYGAVATCSQMARTRTYRACQGFDPAFRRSEDTDFCVRLALMGGHFPGIAQPLVFQSMTRTADKSLDAELRFKLALIDKHRSVFRNEREYLFSREWTITKYAWLAGQRVRFARRLLAGGLAHPVQTWQRLRQALPGMEGNRAFARFHRHGDT